MSEEHIYFRKTWRTGRSGKWHVVEQRPRGWLSCPRGVLLQGWGWRDEVRVTVQMTSIAPDRSGCCQYIRGLAA
jgi:hypothetical protein